MVRYITYGMLCYITCYDMYICYMTYLMLCYTTYVMLYNICYAILCYVIQHVI